MKIEGPVALVTGANRGLGRAIVSALVEAGAAKVYAAARDERQVRRPSRPALYAPRTTRPLLTIDPAPPRSATSDGTTGRCHRSRRLDDPWD